MHFHYFQLCNKYQPKRDAIKAELKALYAQVTQGKDDDAVYAQIDALQQKLDSFPRNSSPKRKRNRCQLTGRPRGVYRRFRLGRNMIRKLAMMGLIPGLRKSSW